ncbi:hypothetical protein ABTC12_19715, partial [Acinetobacter baumannii]
MNEIDPPRRFHLPSVDRVLDEGVGQVAVARFGHQATANAIRAALSRL